LSLVSTMDSTTLILLCLLLLVVRTFDAMSTELCLICDNHSSDKQCISCLLMKLLSYQCYAHMDFLTMPPGGGGPRHGAPKWALGAVMLHSFVPLDSTVTCPLYKLTLAHQSQVTLHLTASLCYLL